MTSAAEAEEGDEGFTLIELLVVMIVFSIIMAIIVSATTIMLNQQRRQNSVGDNLTATRKLLQRLDADVRYANAITQPLIATDGNFYVEWRTGNYGQQQTCTQWRRVAATNQLQVRSWQPSLIPTTPTTYTALTPWATLASTIQLTGTTDIFSLIPIPPQSSANSTHEQLVVTFTSTTGTPPVSTNSQIEITALNTTSNAVPTSVCQEVARS